LSPTRRPRSGGRAPAPPTSTTQIILPRVDRCRCPHGPSIGAGQRLQKLERSHSGPGDHPLEPLGIGSGCGGDRTHPCARPRSRRLERTARSKPVDPSGSPRGGPEWRRPPRCLPTGAQALVKRSSTGQTSAARFLVTRTSAEAIAGGDPQQREFQPAELEQRRSDRGRVAASARSLPVARLSSASYTRIAASRPCAECRPA
jgi:hypothetical protein